ncbi:MAG: serine/threonine-protein kinase [Kofleriaceae bacterium]
MPGDFENAEQTTIVETHDPWVIDHRYRIVRPLGEGGMGVVYEAIQLSVDRPVAIKLLRDNDNETTRRHLLREVRVLTQLHHPNIVDVLDGGQTDTGAVFLVMALVAGATLGDHLAAGRMAWRDACDIAVQLSDALAASHAIGIVHRDLKPGNIMLVGQPTRGVHVKVLDFGIAKPVQAVRGSFDTQAGMIVGTPHYMAPEAIGGELDPRSDLYALGSVLYEMVSGRAPFGHVALDAILWHQMREPPPALPVETPPALAALIYALLAKDPAQRPASATHVRDELLSILVPLPAVTRDPRPRRVARRASFTVPLIFLAMMLVAFVVTLECGR